ncbi:MAG: class I SAM-dependent methyltransferase, partial [Pseudomonadota bacterium]
MLLLPTAIDALAPLADTGGMDAVQAQYEAFPYPARAPGDEARRLIEGSPSHPVEIDHFLFGGRRDWRKPFRALVAGGGTGDGLVMLAQKLADIGCPAEITYLDLSTASRAVAEARVAARGLTSVRFATADLLEAPGLGPFDYIDCCGVLHHLPDPDAGFRALAEALAPEGGMGLMVYAPHGRAGVYPLQDAFGALLADDPPSEKVALARSVLDGLPESAWLHRNPFVNDHRDGDAGLYDLLLHARDRAYEIDAFEAALGRAGLGVAGIVESARYDPARYLPKTDAMSARLARLTPTARRVLAERLVGNIKTHVVYAAPPARAGRAQAPSATLVAPLPGDLVPHLTVFPEKLARAVLRDGSVTLTLDGAAQKVVLTADRRRAEAVGTMLAAVDGRRTLDAILRLGAPKGCDMAL